MKLPATSVLGATKVGETAREILDALKPRLAKATGRKVSRIAVAIVNDWACDGEPEKDATVEAVIKRWAKLAGLED